MLRGFPLMGPKQNPHLLLMQNVHSSFVNCVSLYMFQKREAASIMNERSKIASSFARHTPVPDAEVAAEEAVGIHAFLDGLQFGKHLGTPN